MKTKNRRTLPAMAACYCFGVFNDNYFKQAAMLLAVAAGLNQLQGWAAMLFALPFILFSAHGGWCADRFPKSKVMVAAKGLEIVAMLLGGAGLVLGSWPLILAMVFTMGLQSAFFGPSLNGAIPELFAADKVPKVNALFKLLSTLAILAGMASAGISLDLDWLKTGEVPSGVALVAAVTVVVAAVGFLVSLAIGSTTAASGVKKPLPWLGPLVSVRHFFELSKDRELGLAIIADAWFYFVASMVVLVVNSYGLSQLGLSQTLTSLLSVSLMLGVCVGSFLAASWVKMDRWSAYLVRSSLVMGLGLLLAGTTMLLPESLRFAWLALSLAVAGVAGGLFLIPVTSFLQLRPADHEKGQVIATSGFCSFCAILLSGLIYTLVEPIMTPSQAMAILGLFTLVTTVIFLVGQNQKTSLLGVLLRRLLALRYRIRVEGLEDLDLDPAKGTIFLPNHPALIDPVIVMSTLHDRFRPRPLSAAEQVNKPLVKQVMKMIDPIVLPEVGTGGKGAKAAVHSAINQVIDCLQQGENILFYPAGRLNRSGQEDLRGNSGLEFISRAIPDLQVVLVRTSGLWGSSFSYAWGKAPSLTRQLRLYLRALLAGALFFMPRRQVLVEVKKDELVKTLGERSRINRYLEGWYNEAASPATATPYFWWQKEQFLEQGKKACFSTGRLAQVPVSVQQQVLHKLNDLAGLEVSPEQKLAGDLALDSLTILEVSLWLEREFGVSIEDASVLETVGDCILAATGSVGTGQGEETVKQPPCAWLQNESEDLAFPTAATVTGGFLIQARRSPGRLIVADQISGTRTYRQLLTGIFALLPLIKALEGERLGIMLPASVSATVAYLATLFAGKTPVLFNWTSGVANMEHGIRETGVRHIITATPLVERLVGQGLPLTDLPVDWLYLDQFARKVNLGQKLTALAKAHWRIGELARVKVSETAAILFTSGSEARPKAVPLSHKNIIANLRDFSSLLQLPGDSRLLGMLPPFHSLGLVGTMIMPLCLGLPTVYHANPTEPVKLAALIEAYKVSLAIATPTFLNGILQAAGDGQLASLRLVFTGAEKCPVQVRRELAARVPGAELCEGYGITECSPLVSINLPGKSRPGTIGQLLPSIEAVIVDERLENEVAPGQVGLLLVRGDSIFSGYLGSPEEQGFCQFAGKRWYQTGDFVSLDQGHLHFAGRKKRFIKIAGEMISLPAIENVLLEELGGTSENGPALAIEATEVDSHPEIVMFSRNNFTREEVNSAIRRAGLSALHHVRRLVQLSEIPVLGSGKTDYALLKRMLTS